MADQSLVLYLLRRLVLRSGEGAEQPPAVSSEQRKRRMFHRLFRTKMTFGMSAIVYFILTHFVIIIYIMARVMARRTASEGRRHSALDVFDITTIITTSIFPDDTPSYIMLLGQFSRWRQRQKNKTAARILGYLFLHKSPFDM